MVVADARFTQQVQNIICKAGDLAMTFFKRPLQVTEKDNGTSFATNADIAVEQFLLENLAPIIPDACFLAEESGSSGSNEYCWVIDPIDGTRNFLRGIGYFAISVGLTLNNKPIWGAVYHPVTQEFFHAVKDGGAFLNGQPIKVATPAVYAQSNIILALPYAKDGSLAQVLACLDKSDDHNYTARHFGSTALDTVYVACGRLDAMFFKGLSWWDIAAGMLIIEQAGGTVTDFTGGKVALGYASFVASNGAIHQDMLGLLKDACKI